MKVDVLAQRLSPVLSLLRCPLCGERFDLVQGQARCFSGHCFDLSSKGYLNVAPGHVQRKEKYDADLFTCRHRVLEGGFYLPVVNAIETMLSNRFSGASFTLIDVGCGEGYYARSLAACFPQAVCFGVDLSREGIQRAARDTSVRWLVADLKRLPFAPGTADVVLDVLTPADYQAFGRVLKPDGELIKIIPGEDYLKEIRLQLPQRLAEYSNRKVEEHFLANAELKQRLTVRQTFSLSPEQSADFLRMTPMTFSVPEEILQTLSLSSVTIHMEILRGLVRR